MERNPQPVENGTAMRYFSYIAEQSFKTDEEGRRLFYIGTPFSRPYVIADESMEQRLQRKMTWYHRLTLGPAIVGMALGASFLRRPWLFLFERPWLLFIVLVVAVSAAWVLLRVIFYKELRTMPRAAARVSLRTFYGSMAQKHSRKGLLLGLFASLLFVATGIWMSLYDNSTRPIGVTIAAFFGIVAAAWAYTLWLKETGGND
ncbi:MAG: hypothetical protein WD468_13210 [Pirellulales bacterium]